MTPDELIAETLRLDAEATKGPWTYAGMIGDIDTPLRHFVTAANGKIVLESEGFNADYAGLDRPLKVAASYRTAAPRLARMLKVAMEGLRSSLWCSDDADAALAEIEKIAREES